MWLATTTMSTVPGLEPKGLNPYTVRVMTEKGIDMSGHCSKDVTEYLGKMNFGYLITVCSRAEEILAKFREVRDQNDSVSYA